MVGREAVAVRLVRRSGRRFLLVLSLHAHGEPNGRKGRDSCFVKTSEFAPACASRQANAVSRASGFVKTRMAVLPVRTVRGQRLGARHAVHAAPQRTGRQRPGGFSVPTRLGPDGRGWGFCSLQRRHHFQPKPAPIRKKRLKGFSTNEHHTSHVKSRKAVIRVS